MSEFEKWSKNHERKTIGFLTQGGAVEYGEKVGWKAAFENMKQWIMGRRCTGEDVLNYINKELLAQNRNQSSSNSTPGNSEQ